MNSFRAVERALAYEADRQYEVWQETASTTGRRAETDPRLGRPSTDHQAATEQRRIERLSLFSRSRPRARRGHASRSVKWLASKPGRTAGRAARATAAAVRPRLPTTPMSWSIKVAHWSTTLSTPPRHPVTPKKTSNWIQRDVMAAMNETNTSIDQFSVSALQLAELDDPRSIRASCQAAAPSTCLRRCVQPQQSLQDAIEVARASNRLMKASWSHCASSCCRPTRASSRTSRPASIKPSGR